MFRNKRQGVELATNTIIIFALVILVLLVLAFIIMGGFQNWNRGTSCTANKGECKTVCDDNKPIIAAYSCKETGTHCCTAFLGAGG